jgi:hypothetical protein
MEENAARTAAQEQSEVTVKTVSKTRKDRRCAGCKKKIPSGSSAVTTHREVYSDYLKRNVHETKYYHDEKCRTEAGQTQ